MQLGKWFECPTGLDDRTDYEIWYPRANGWSCFIIKGQTGWCNQKICFLLFFFVFYFFY